MQEKKSNKRQLEQTLKRRTVEEKQFTGKGQRNELLVDDTFPSIFNVTDPPMALTVETETKTRNKSTTVTLPLELGNVTNVLDAKRKELKLVDDELSLIELELQQLFTRQQMLLKRRKYLQQSLNNASQANSSTDKDEWNRTDFKWSKELHEVSSSVFKISEFRSLQLQAINATLSERDCIVVMPTGGGKSLCYQLPAILSKGITLVVTPLVSLMEDQVMCLSKFSVGASMLNAASTQEEVKFIQGQMVDPKSTLRLLYVTPEKLAKSKRFMSNLEKTYRLNLLARIAIDEVHCCSQWGHDFRPDYKFLGVLRRQFPKTPIIGLTATAASDVIDDVKKMLDIPNALLFQAPLDRPNLFYEVYPKPSPLSDSVNLIANLIKSRFKGRSGIIYCLSQKDTETVAQQLQGEGLKVKSYHANMVAKERSHVHSLWTNNEIQVIVATIAFGMGIDKPDVAFVIHHSISKSMENYYQESGRAGRDNLNAHCILYVSFNDLFRQSTMVFTEQTGLEKLYGMMAYATDLKTCRRSLIFENLRENWSSSCRGMCDHCDEHQIKNLSVVRDVTDYCRDIIKILNEMKSSNQRITGLKLIETWNGKGSAATVVLGIAKVSPSKLPRSEMERIIIYMLLNGYLKEDFHFTPYNTISYVVSGNRAKMLNSTEHSIEIPIFCSTSQRNSISSKSAKETETSSIKEDAKKRKRKDKTEKMRLSSSGKKKEEDEDEEEEKGQSFRKRIRLKDEEGNFKNEKKTTLHKKLIVNNSKTILVIDDDDN